MYAYCEYGVSHDVVDPCTILTTQNESTLVYLHKHHARVVQTLVASNETGSVSCQLFLTTFHN